MKDKKKSKKKQKDEAPSSNQLKVPTLMVDGGTADEEHHSLPGSFADNDVEELKNLVQELEELKLEAEEQREIIEEQDVIINQLAKQAMSLENVCGRPCQLVWKVSGFKKRLELEQSGQESVLFSPPFYTHNKGYKVGLSLCINGDGSGEGTHMSIFFCLLWSKFDPLSSWPFSLPIELSLLDQREDVTKRKNLVTKFKPNPIKENLPYLGRPQNFRNPSVGLPLWVAHTDMFNGQGKYVLDDNIYIQAKIDIEDVLKL